MPTPDASSPAARRQALLTLRFIWAALILSQVVFSTLVLCLVLAGQRAPSPELGPTLLYIAASMLLVLTPLGYFIRSQTYKANWRGNAIAPAGYTTGNIILLAMLEGVSFFSLVAVLVTGELLPIGLISLVALAVQAVNFPTGRPLEPAPLTNPV